MSCPDCNSERAVPKWEAWDALCEVPKKTQDRLEQLERLALQASAIAKSRYEDRDESEVLVWVPERLVSSLAHCLPEDLS